MSWETESTPHVKGKFILELTPKQKRLVEEKIGEILAGDDPRHFCVAFQPFRFSGELKVAVLENEFGNRLQARIKTGEV